jgi:hypothetical protein
LSPACIGCGYCCKKEMCRIGAMVYGVYKQPCPALKKTDERYACELYRSDPLRYGEILAIGEGCCFPGNPFRDSAFEKE